MAAAWSEGRAVGRAGARWIGACLAVALLPLQAGCDLAPPQPQAQPVQPPRPARVARPRPAEAPRTAEAAPVASGQADPAPEEAEPAPPPRQEARPVRWQVVADRTVGCAVPDTLRMLRSTEGLGESQPRLAAQARREGRCATTFRVSEWTLLRADGELVLLRLANPPPGIAAMELWFMRRDVTPSAGGAAQPTG